MAKRKLFDELMESIAAMKAHREGEIALRAHKSEPAKAVNSKAPLTGEKRP